MLEPRDVLIFRDADLGKVSFMATDLREAEMTNVDWHEIVWPKKMPKTLRWLRSKRFGVYDEDSLLKSGTDFFPHVERLYRELKQNYEDRKDYERAGDFHYGEKEMRRRNPKTSWGLWFWLTVYRLIGGYGERWVRSLVFAAILWIICTVTYLLSGLSNKDEGYRLVLTNGWDFLQSAHYSLRVMTLLKPEDLVPVGFGKVINTVQILLGPVLIGFFALALRQRLKR